MDRFVEYLELGRQCRELAETAETRLMRARYLQMADTWDVLARQRAASLGVEAILASLPSGDNSESVVT